MDSSSDAYGYSGDEGASGTSEDGDYGFDPHAEVETSARQVRLKLGRLLAGNAESRSKFVLTSSSSRRPHT